MPIAAGHCICDCQGIKHIFPGDMTALDVVQPAIIALAHRRVEGPFGDADFRVLCPTMTPSTSVMAFLGPGSKHEGGSHPN